MKNKIIINSILIGVIFIFLLGNFKKTTCSIKEDTTNQMSITYQVHYKKNNYLQEPEMNSIYLENLTKIIEINYELPEEEYQVSIYTILEDKDTKKIINEVVDNHILINKQEVIDFEKQEEYISKEIESLSLTGVTARIEVKVNNSVISIPLLTSKYQITTSFNNPTSTVCTDTIQYPLIGISIVGILFILESDTIRKKLKKEEEHV